MPSPRTLTAALALAVAAPALAGELRGRLLVAGKPASGATVTAVPWTTSHDEARRDARGEPEPAPIASVRAGADGRFVLATSPEPGKPARTFRLRLSGGGSAASVFDGVWDESESEDLGEHDLPRGDALAGKVVDDEGKAVADAEVRLSPGTARREMDDAVVRDVRVARTRGDGTFRFEDASESGNALVVRKKDFAPTRVTNLRAGALRQPVVLAPGWPVSGAVRKPGGKSPAAGVLVRFEGKAATAWVITDAEGKFLIDDAPVGRGLLVADGDAAGWAEKRDVPSAENAKPVTLTLAPPASLEGRVLDAKTSRPVARAKVEVRLGSDSRSVRSGPDGKYRLAPLPPRDVRLRVDEVRYVPWVRPHVPIAPGEGKKVDVPLVLGASLTGRVTDEDGNPIADAEGRLARGGEGGLATFLRQMRGGEGSAFRSAPDGSFRATRLAPGENQRLEVAHATHERAVLPGVSLVGGAVKSGVVVVMRKGSVLAGQIVDREGRPVDGAEVEAQQQAVFRGGRGGMTAMMQFVGGPVGAGRPRATSGADGRFVLDGIAPGDWELQATKRGYATERTEPVKVGDGAAAEPVRIVLEPGASITGFVRKKSGDGAEGFIVTASSPGRGRGFRGNQSFEPTGPDGAFFVDGLKAGGTYDINLLGGAALGAGTGKRGVTAPADGIEITVSTPGRIEGVATDAETGRPLTSFEVSYEPERSGPGGGMVIRMGRAAAGGRAGGSMGEKVRVEAEDGRFALSDVPPGTWQVVVEAKGYQTARTGGVAVEEGETKSNVEVKVSAGVSLAGRVLDARSGRPVPDATVTVEPAAGGGPGGMAFLAMASGEGEITTDADGKFEAPSLAPGKYRVTARHPDYAEGSETAEAKSGATPVDVRLGSGGRLGGTVFSDARQPLPGVSVSVVPAGDAGFGPAAMLGGGGQVTVTDASGRFRFDRLNAGRYTVTATSQSKKSPAVDAILAANETKDDVAVVLSAGATLHGLVSGLADGERGGVNVVATGADSWFATATTGADGRFQIAGAPTGPVNVRATAGDFLTGTTRVATKQVVVADGAPDVDVEVAFEKGFAISGRVTRGGRPLDGAFVNVSLERGGGRGAQARADENGAFRVEGLPEGTYVVTATAMGAGGSGAMKRQTVSVTGDQSVDLAIPAARISGVVVDGGTRQAIADATVELSGDGPGMMRVATTDSSGRFAFTDLESADYTLNARKAGYQYERRTAAASDGGAEDLRIELQRGEGVGIVVKDGLYGFPLRSVVVRALDGQRNAVYTGSVSLDGEGRGEVSSLKAGTYTLNVDASGYATRQIEGVRAPASGVPVALTPGGTLEIHSGPQTLARGTATAILRTSTGAPAPLSIFATDGRLTLSQAVRQIENLAPGGYTLAVDGGATKSLTIPEGGRALVELP